MSQQWTFLKQTGTKRGKRENAWAHCIQALTLEAMMPTYGQLHHPLLSWEEESVQLSSLSFRRSNADSVVNMKQLVMSFSLQRCCKDHGTWLSFLLEFCKHGNCASHSIFVMRGVGQWGIVAMYHLLFIEVLHYVIIQLYFLCISGFQLACALVPILLLIY